MLVYLIHKVLLFGNLVLLAACFYFGPKLHAACRVGIGVNALALAFLGIPLLNLLLAPNPPSESSAAIHILVTATVPLLAEFAALLAIWRWRMRPR